jgi:hypothetical protein
MIWEVRKVHLVPGLIALPVDLVGQLIHACARACLHALHTCIPWGYESLSAGSVLQEKLCYYDH